MKSWSYSIFLIRPDTNIPSLLYIKLMPNFCLLITLAFISCALRRLMSYYELMHERPLAPVSVPFIFVVKFSFKPEPFLANIILETINFSDFHFLNFVWFLYMHRLWDSYFIRSDSMKKEKKVFLLFWQLSKYVILHHKIFCDI